MLPIPSTASISAKKIRIIIKKVMNVLSFQMTEVSMATREERGLKIRRSFSVYLNEAKRTITINILLAMF